LQVLPMSVISALDGLTRLEMANNQLQSIPEGIGNMK
jgi:Leucine-rich repeat (LRR) protein